MARSKVGKDYSPVPQSDLQPGVQDDDMMQRQTAPSTAADRGLTLILGGLELAMLTNASRLATQAY